KDGAKSSCRVRPVVFMAIDMPRAFRSAMRSRSFGASNGSPYMLGWTSGLAAMSSSSRRRDAARSIIPTTESIAFVSSDPQTGHIGQRRLHLVARSRRTRGGNSGTGSGFQSSVASTQSAFDQSRMIQNLLQLRQYTRQFRL